MTSENPQLTLHHKENTKANCNMVTREFLLSFLTESYTKMAWENKTSLTGLKYRTDQIGFEVNSKANEFLGAIRNLASHGDISERDLSITPSAPKFLLLTLDRKPLGRLGATNSNPATCLWR